MPGDHQNPTVASRQRGALQLRFGCFFALPARCCREPGEDGPGTARIDRVLVHRLLPVPDRPGGPPPPRSWNARWASPSRRRDGHPGSLARSRPSCGHRPASSEHRYTAGTSGGSARTTEGQPCRRSNQVTVRPPHRRHPHRVASPATSRSPRPPSASRPAGPGSGTPGPLRSVTSTRTALSQALTATVTVQPAAPEPLCRTLLPKSSLPAGQRHPRTGAPARAPHPRRRGRPAPGPPARQASRSPEPPSRPPAHPPFPAALVPGNHAGHRTDTGMHARLGGARQSGTRQRGPSPAVREISRPCTATVLVAPPSRPARARLRRASRQPRAAPRRFRDPDPARPATLPAGPLLPRRPARARRTVSGGEAGLRRPAERPAATGGRAVRAARRPRLQAS
jgi:hypothetical protein